jgi:hypothetical protein
MEKIGDLSSYARFNIEKIIQILAYIQRETRTRSKLEMIKYLFLSDRANMRRNFSFISRDRYFALKYGPVAAGTLDLLNKEDAFFNYPEDELLLIDKIDIIDNRERQINETAMDLLSKNEIDSLDFAINTFKGTRLVEVTHEYPEWKRYKDLFDKRLTSQEPIIMMDFFTNPVLDDSPYLKKTFGKDPMYLDEDYLSEAREFYQDRYSYE